MNPIESFGIIPCEPPTRKLFQNLTGRKFGRLTVLSLAGKRNLKYYWNCVCDCGKATISKGVHMTRGVTKSCGCFRADAHYVKHGATKTPEHATWRAMRSRCSDPNVPCWKDYGGRGIKVCERWDSFELFLTDMGLRPTPKHSIDRRDNDRGYCPENCYWATQKEQIRNRRTSRVLTFNGQTKPLGAWVDEFNIPYKILYKRVIALWSADRALKEPVRKRA